MKIVGQLEKTEQSTGTKQDGTQWTRYVYTVSGKRYSCFEDQKAVTGKTYEVEFENNNGFNNIKSMTETTKPNTPENNQFVGRSVGSAEIRGKIVNTLIMSNKTVTLELVDYLEDVVFGRKPKMSGFDNQPLQEDLED